MGSTCCKQSPVDEERSTGIPDADESVLRFLAQVQLFKRLPAALLPSVAGLAAKVEFQTGDVVIRQGDEGHEFFVIMNGKASVEVDGKNVATLKSGDYFGENALLRDEPRTATIKTTERISALKITREQFRRLGLQEKLEFAKRGAVGGGANKEVKVQPPSPKTPEERVLMAEALKKNTNISTMISLNDSQLKDIIDIAWKEKVATGAEIIRQGDLDADYFYIVQEGTFDVFVSGTEGKSAEQAAAAVASISKGGSFGELALLYFAPRAATIKAKGDGVVWVIDRKNFKDILMKKDQDNVKTFIAYLKKIKILAPLKDKDFKEVARALQEMSFNRDEVIMQEKEKGDSMYILIGGQVMISRGNRQETVDATMTSPSVFGEKALMSSETRPATVRVTSDTARALTLDRETFEMMLGPLGDIQKSGSSKAKAADTSSKPAGSDARYGLIKKKDLKRLGLLGCGGFGAVELVEHVKSGDTFALKALSKGYIVKSGMQASVVSEKDVQLLCDSPFVVRLYETFNGEQSLYFLLELALGGELYATYNRKDFYGKEPHAKFYVAGVVYAFDHMHQRKIIFRDLKPENLLLNEAGHIKITDMGLAKVVAVGKTFTTCGTPDYFAPELIQSAGHTRALDWWTLGILTFELLVGRPPFESASPMQIYQKVVKGIDKVAFPKKARGHPEQLIKGLCKTEPSERLPMKKGGIANVQDCSWYGGFDWNAMKSLTMVAPYKPHVAGKKDVTNFTARKEDMPPHVFYKDDGSGWDKNFATSS